VYISRSVLLLILAAYVFSPTAFGWMIDPGGGVVPALYDLGGIVATTFLLQSRAPDNEDGL